MTDLVDKNRRILIVDDNPSIHDDFRKILSPVIFPVPAWGAAEAVLFEGPEPPARPIQFELASAYQGREGMALVEQARGAGRPYAAAFVDVRMPPGWDGVETTRKIWEADPDLQVVLCTAYSDYSWDEVLDKLGQRDNLLILKKPFEAVEALQLATALTEKWWLHQQNRRVVGELERRVIERTREWQRTNDRLQTEIAEHTRATAELRWKTAFLEAQVNSSIDGILVVDQRGRKILQNQRVVDLLEIPREIADNSDDAQQVKWVTGMMKDPGAFLARVGQLYSQTGEIGRDELELKNGAVLDRFSSPVVGKDGAYYGRIWTFRDITGRKRIEEALRASEANLAAAQRIAHFGSWELELAGQENPDANGLRWSDEMYRIAGFEPGAVEVSSELFFRLVPPAEREGIRRAVAAAIVERRQYSIVHRLLRPDGGERIVQEIGQVVVDERTGQPAKIIGTAHDITERQTADNALRESEERFSTAFEHAPIGMALVSPGGRWLKVNRAICELVGYPEAALLTRTFQDITHPDDLAADLEHASRLIAGEISTYQMEKRYVHRLGHSVTVLLNVSLVRDAGGGPRYFISQIQDITERKRIENALRESHEQFHQLADNITDVFWIRSPDLREVHYVSPAFERIWGRSMASLLANPREWSDFILPEDRERVIAAFAALTGDRAALDVEYRITRPGGEIRWVRVRGFQVRNAVGELIRHTGIVTDITERRQLELQLFQSQKLETVGRLAGGIAHEFNSILTAIIGRSELLLDDLAPGNPLRENASEIREAAARAATLTRQLLAYGRKQTLRPVLLDLNTVLVGMESTVRELMGREVTVRLTPATGLELVKADLGQIEQVIMNLAMNAADAMPDGGRLTLETANVAPGLQPIGHITDLAAGNYVQLAITDSGKGMTDETKARIFEPFFTTKDVGGGPGLGLSTCYGIINQSGGHIMVESETGRGTTFRIFLPRAEGPERLVPSRPGTPESPRGSESILLVEEDPALRELATAMLGRLGYLVLPAANGGAALTLGLRRDDGPIDLLLANIDTPPLGGVELAARLRARHPRVKTLFTAAQTGSASLPAAGLKAGVVLLSKPFTPAALARGVREALDHPGPHFP